nr:MAG TPA: tail protein [Caudoviricetes sp.]
MYKARSVKPVIRYNNKDISADVRPYLKSMSYTDNMSGEADSLEISLEDRQGLWEGSWMPDKRATLDALFLLQNWDQTMGGSSQLDLGKFEIDTIDYQYAPAEMTIKGVSIPDNNKLRGENRSRSWEKVKLSTICNDIAVGAALELNYTAPDDPELDRVEQSEESDLAFLWKLLKDQGLALKIFKTQLIVFDEADYEKVEPQLTLVKPGTVYQSIKGMVYLDEIKSCRFNSKIRDTYKACHVKYKSGKKSAVIEATYTAPDKTEGKTLQVNEQVKSVAEAERLAKKKLRDKNKEETTGSFELMGNLNLLTTLTIQVKGFGKFDGRYIITSAKHSIGSGYTTTIDIRRCLNGY